MWADYLLRATRNSWALLSRLNGISCLLMLGVTWKRVRLVLKSGGFTKEFCCDVHHSWSLAIPAEFSTPMSHEIVLSMATSAWLHNFPELSLPPLLSFHCLLRPAEARHLRWCDVQTFDGSLVTKKLINIDQPKVRRMAGHAAQQQVLVECVGIGQIAHAMRSSIPITNSMQQFGILPHHADALLRNCRPSVQRKRWSTSLRSAQQYSLPLSDVGRKTKGIQTTHTIRAHPH